MSENTRKDSPEVDHVIPGSKWEFGEEVTAVFDDMLRRSIPQYDVMRRSVFEIGRKFVSPQTTIIDLGCSRGDALEPFVKQFADKNLYHGVEVSEPMLSAARQRFVREIDYGLVRIQKLDLRTDFPTGAGSASLVLSVLTLMFIPMEYRLNVMAKIYKCLAPGGALILVEKILGSRPALDSVFIDVYLDTKRAHGYSEEEIQRKRLSLEGVLVPMAAEWNLSMLDAAGFKTVDCFWRWMNFAAWIAVKE